MLAMHGKKQKKTYKEDLEDKLFGFFSKLHVFFLALPVSYLSEGFKELESFWLEGGGGGGEEGGGTRL